MRLAGVVMVRLTRPARKVPAVSGPPERMTLAALNRALLARQGLLDRLDVLLVEAVESVGALQAQYWPAPPVALWSRVEGFDLDAFYAALEDGELVTGTLLRVTLHVVSAREHLAYAAVAAEAAGYHWCRTDAELGAEVAQLLTKLRAYTRTTPRSGEEIRAVVEEWVAAHPKALALDEVVRRHLRAFGPAGPDDVAGWIGWRTPPVREAFERLGADLERLEDEDGRGLYDLPDAPRPDPE